MFFLMKTAIKQRIRHPWNLLTREAMTLQSNRSQKLILDSNPPISRIEIVAGIDTHYDEFRATAAVVSLDLKTMQPVEIATAATRIDFPCIPGLFCFGKAPQFYQP